MAYETIRVEPGRGILRVILSRPERQNSITSQLLRELHAALDLAERTPDCRIVVIEGENGVFCTGMDFHEVAQNDAAQALPTSRGGEEFLELLKRFTTINRVIVAQVDGRVSGGGVGIAAASDFVYATERSQFSLPEALWGLLPCCVVPFLIRRVGFHKAYTMSLSTHPVGARQAAEFQLVDEVVEDAEPAIRRLLFRIAKLDDVTIRDLKRYFNKMWIISQEMETTALQEFSRLMSSSVVQERIVNFATRQKFPWES